MQNLRDIRRVIVANLEHHDKKVPVKHTAEYESDNENVVEKPDDHNADYNVG